MREAEASGSAPLWAALGHAARGWHVLPLSAVSKRPLGNCPACRDTQGISPHPVEKCPCIPRGAWCHGVRAATTDPDRIRTWWRREPGAIPGIATGPSDLVLIDIDTHGDDLPAGLATGLLPGIDLAAEHLPAPQWQVPGDFRDGRDTLQLLARLRGGRYPWPTDAEHRPVTVITPSGGRHLWYRAPTGNLRQAGGQRGLAWRVDIKAGWSYGIAPGATSRTGPYRQTSGDITTPGHMPPWLAREVIRVASRTRPPTPTAGPRKGPTTPRRDRAPAAYLTTVINRGAAHLATLTDGRKRALAALAYQTGGLLDWSGLPHQQTTQQLITAGTTAGLKHNIATRIVHRSLANGLAAPLTPNPRNQRPRS